MKIKLPKKFFIIGTDTDIGKTVASIALCLSKNYKYSKLVECGTPWDSEKAVKILKKENVFKPLYSFKKPASPHIAAKNENTKINIKKLKKWFINLPNNTIIEGAGGLHVPLTDQYLLSDFIQESNLPVVLVISSRVGTINHTLLTIEALESRKIAIFGIMVQGKPEDAVINFIKKKTRILCVFPLQKRINWNTLKNICNQTFF